MKNGNPAHRPFLNITTFVIFLPLLAMAILLPFLGMFASVRILFYHGRWFDYPIVIFLSGLHITSVVLILWKSRLGWGLCAFYLALILMYLHPLVTKRYSGDFAFPSYAIAIGRTSHIQGVDVYCNGVDLGKTPLVISEKDFRHKVKPWQQPPRQEILTGSKWIPYDSYDKKFFYVPNNYFERYRENRRESLYRDKDASREILRTSRYWWHFEKDGCLGVAPIKSNLGASGGWTRTITVNPESLYPSVKPHLNLLLHSLRNSQYKPTEEWVTHFRRYSELLFHEFYKKIQHEPALTRVLHAMVKDEFGINDEMSDRDIERVVDEIMTRAEQRQAFTIPSPESIALDLLGQRASKTVEERVKFSALSLRRGSRTSGTGEERITTRYQRGQASRFLPLDYAIRQIKPPRLFNRLVYESSRRSYFIGLLGNYQRQEAVRLVRSYLHNASNVGIFKVNRINQAMGVASQIRNPVLEEELFQFLRNNRIGFSIAFIESRLNSPVTNSDLLADWLFESTSLAEHQKLEYLSRVNSPNAYSYVQNLIRNTGSRTTVIQSLTERPNPTFDQFLIDTYEAYPNLSNAAVQAMLAGDTPKMQEYLDNLWQEENQEFLLEGMSKMEQGDARLVRWTSPISELTETPLRLFAVPVLSLIDTPEAAAILASWAAETEEQLSIIAQEHLNDYHKRQRQAADLIAGKIKPDDLLPPQTPYIWDGQDYVPEFPIADEQ